MWKNVKLMSNEVFMKKIRAMIILFIGAIIWGFAFVAQRLGGSMGTYTFNALRFLLGSISILPVIYIFEKKDDPKKAKDTILPGIICGIFLFVASTFQQYGIIMTDFAGKCGFITDFYIILVPLFGLFLHQKPPVQVWIGASITLIGFYFLCMTSNSFSINFGDILLFVCAIFFTGQILSIDYYTKKVYPLRLSFYQFMTCSVLSFIGSFLFEKIDLISIQEALIPLLYGGIMSVGVGYTLQAVGQKDCDSTTSAIIMSSESVFCTIGSALILKETMPLQSYFGCILVFIGILLAQMPNKEKKHGSNI